MNVDEFLEFLFPDVNDCDPPEVIVIAGDGAKSATRTREKKNTSWRPRAWVPGELGNPPGRIYFGISTIIPNEDGELEFKTAKLGKKEEAAIAAHNWRKTS